MTIRICKICHRAYFLKESHWGQLMQHIDLRHDRDRSLMKHIDEYYIEKS